MRRFWTGLLAAAVLLTLAACGKQAPTWQEQYDLGVKYLEEGSYEEAIIAFTAAIEIDPKQALAYTGRAGAYLASGETEENLAAALADYEAALEADDTLAAAYLGMADVYIRQGDFDRALEILQRGLEATDDQEISRQLEEMESGTFTDAGGKTRRSSHYENGELQQYWIYEYDQKGNNVKTTCYASDGTWKSTEESTFNEQGQEISSVENDEHGNVRNMRYTYDQKGRLSRKDISYSSGSQSYTLYSYDELARTQTQDDYDVQESGAVLTGRFVVEMDKDGVRRKANQYSVDENGELYLSYYVNYIWNSDGTYGGYTLVDVAGDRDGEGS